MGVAIATIMFGLTYARAMGHCKPSWAKHTWSFQMLLFFIFSILIVLINGEQAVF